MNEVGSMKDHGLASVALHVFLLILRDKYSDAEIKRILSRRNINGALEIINELEGSNGVA